MPHLSKQNDELGSHRVGQNLVPESVAGIWSITLSARLTLHNYCVHPWDSAKHKNVEEIMQNESPIELRAECLWVCQTTLTSRSDWAYWAPSPQILPSPPPQPVCTKLPVKSLWLPPLSPADRQPVLGCYRPASASSHVTMSSPAKSLGWPSKSKGNPIGRSNFMQTTYSYSTQCHTPFSLGCSFNEPQQKIIMSNRHKLIFQFSLSATKRRKVVLFTCSSQKKNRHFQLQPPIPSAYLT